ncbi:hypothetical protein PYCC9005_002810 [Savitreella phatthalungensis]
MLICLFALILMLRVVTAVWTIDNPNAAALSCANQTIDASSVASWTDTASPADYIQWAYPDASSTYGSQSSNLLLINDEGNLIVPCARRGTSKHITTNFDGTWAKVPADDEGQAWLHC